MNLLIDGTPKSVWIDGKEYPLRCQFSYSVLFEMLMLDPTVSQNDKLESMLRLYFPLVPADTEQAVEAVLWFYRCGKEPEQEKHRGGTGKQEQIYSFEYDDSYFYAAFLQQYGIDLVQEKDLHWWKFKALFNGLTDSCELRKIMSYRAMKIDTKLPKEQKEFYWKMKELYRIPKGKNEQEKLNAIEQALLNGGDLTNLL